MTLLHSKTVQGSHSTGSPGENKPTFQFQITFTEINRTFCEPKRKLLFWNPQKQNPEIEKRIVSLEVPRCANIRFPLRTAEGVAPVCARGRGHVVRLGACALREHPLEAELVREAVCTRRQAHVFRWRCNR